MRDKKLLLLLFLILFLGLILRTYKLNTNFIFGVDQAEDMFKFKEIVTDIARGNFSNLPLIGEPGTDLTDNKNVHGDYVVYSGALFLYLVTPFALISRFDPSILVYFFSSANLLGVILIYLVTKKLSGSVQAVFASLLYSVNFYMSTYSRAIWTPSLVPVFLLTALYLWSVVKEGRESLVPAYLFFASAISQLHDSGYYYMFFFIILALASRIRLFAKDKVVYNSMAFLAPLTPTLIYEVSTGFRFFKHIIGTLLTNSTSINSDLIVGIFGKFWEFFVSINFPLYFHNFFSQKYSILYIPLLTVITLVTTLGLFLPIIKRDKKLGVLFFVFIMTFLVVPYASKVFYNDSYFGLFPLFGTTFSTLGAMPIVIISVGVFLGNLYLRGGVVKFLSLAVVSFLVLNQIPLIKSTIWENGERKYDYGNKLDIIKTLGDNVHSGYSLEYLDPDSYGEGYEFFYIIETANVRLPYSYNGATEKTTLFHRYEFGKNKPSDHFAIAGRRVWDKFSVEEWHQLGESGEFRIFRQK